MTWNYRVVKKDTEHGPMWELHEVHYDEDGQPTARTMEPATFGSDDGPHDIIRALEMALSDAKYREVLDDPWPDEEGAP